MTAHDETVMRLEREVGLALQRRDVDTLRRLFADDFIGINPIGDEVAMAIVTEQGTARGTYKGQRADMVFVYTRIWVMREGAWLAVAAHASPVR
jgi:hypothetical protein